MKLRLIILSAILLLAPACKRSSGPKDLVVYFSHTGTTETLAGIFAQQTGAEMLRLECEEAYPDSFEATLAISGEEIRDAVGRPLKNCKVDLEPYNTIYIGYPVWYGTIPPPVRTFVTDNDMGGKKVVIFCTYGSGGLKSSSRTLEDLMPETEIAGRFGIAARRMEHAAEEVAAFLAGSGKAVSDSDEGYSEPRSAEGSDLEVFRSATAGYAYLNLVPFMVSVREEPGLTSWIFVCESSMGDSPTRKVEVLILQKEGEEPYLQSVEKI